MKTAESVKAISLAMTIIVVFVLSFSSVIYTLFGNKEYVSENKVLEDNKLSLDIASATYDTQTRIENMNISESDVMSAKVVELSVAEADYEEEKVYDNMTVDELADKLNRTLHSTIAGQGYTFASYALELGIDPYIAVAIVMHETGCEWQCSALLNQCNNVGGMKGTGGCNGGSYASFATLEEGIKAFMNNLNKNYFSQGLTTPETIGPKYAESSTWSAQVNAYVAKIKAA